MAGVNKVILVGNLGQDPEIRSSNAGQEFATLNLATSESWKDRNTGERQTRTEWHRVVVFSEGLVRIIKSYIKKGSKIYVEGQLRTRKWEGQDGVERYTTETVLSGFNGTIIMLDSPNQNNGGGGFGGGNSFGNNNGGGNGGGLGGSSDPFAPSGNDIGADLDDEIPF